MTQTIQLVHRAQGGDAESLNRLVERYFERVRRVVRARIGPRLRRWHDSGDVAQQTFLVAVKELQNFEVRDDAALIHWLAKIAENQIRGLDAKMKAKRRDTGRDVSLSELGDADEGSDRFDLPSETKGPVDTVEAGEEQRLLDDALADLDAEYRELILLRDYIGHSWEQVAAQLGKPSADAARMQYATARAKLAQRIRGAR